MSYLAERFEAAVLILVGHEPVKDRLARAYTAHLEHLRDAELPAKLRPTFTALQTALHRVEPMGNNDSSVRCSVQKMSSTEAGRHAEAIFELYSELLRSGQRAEPLKVVDTDAGSNQAIASP